MSDSWQDYRCASLDVRDLAALADLRREPGIRVASAAGRAWVRWGDAPTPEATRRILVERLLPLPSARVFTEHDGRWHAPGAHLPAFDVPAIERDDWVPLDRWIFPEPAAIEPPSPGGGRPVLLRLVRDERGTARPATAMRCPLAKLAAWVDGAPSSWIASMAGAFVFSDGGDPLAREAFVIVSPGDIPRHSARAELPMLEGSVRYWGEHVRVPIGFRTDPVLSEAALREAAGISTEELAVVEESGLERIPRLALRTLDRAGIRLAAAMPGRPAGAGPP